MTRLTRYPVKKERFAGQRQDAPHHACMPQTPAHRSRDQKSTSTQPRWLRSSAPCGRSAFRPNQRRPSSATTPAEALPEATRRGRARRWRPRRGRGAKGSNGMGNLTHGLMRARTMLQKSKAKNCEDRLERVARLATGSCAGGRLAGVHGVFFLITVLKLLETSTDHFIFNVSEVQLFRFQIFKQDSCV